MTGKLFFDDEFDALQQMVANSAKSHKEVASFLWPDMKPESAYAKLKACLNPAGDERLKFGQIIAAMNFCGSFDPLQFACDETLHARPTRVAPEDEEVKLLDVLTASADTMNRAMAQIERLRKVAKR